MSILFSPPRVISKVCTVSILRPGLPNSVVAPTSVYTQPPLLLFQFLRFGFSLGLPVYRRPSAFHARTFLPKRTQGQHTELLDQNAPGVRQKDQVVEAAQKQPQHRHFTRRTLIEDGRSKCEIEPGHKHDASQ